MTNDESSFRQVVAATLKKIAADVDAIEADGFDSRLADGVFQVDFEAGGTFVLSQQVPTRELWLSANAHAWHFRADEAGRWPERDRGEPLADVLEGLFSKKLGRPVRFGGLRG